MAQFTSLEYTKDALKSLEAIPLRFRKQIVKRINALLANPRPSGYKLIKGTEGDERVYRIRSGNYRVLYVLRNPKILILDIGDRKDIYEP